MWLKIKQEGQAAGFGPCFHLPGFRFGIPVFRAPAKCFPKEKPSGNKPMGNQRFSEGFPKVLQREKLKPKKKPSWCSKGTGKHPKEPEDTTERASQRLLSSQKGGIPKSITEVVGETPCDQPQPWPERATHPPESWAPRLQELPALLKHLGAQVPGAQRGQASLRGQGMGPSWPTKKQHRPKKSQTNNRII